VHILLAEESYTNIVSHVTKIQFVIFIFKITPAEQTQK